jgi:predicted nucleotidyltransferase
MVIDVRSRLGISDEQLAHFCKRWKIATLEIFGSALRDDFTEASDIDLLYVFEEDANWSLFDVLAAEEELGAILGRKVDLVSRHAIENSENWMRRREILETSRVLYSAG